MRAGLSETHAHPDPLRQFDMWLREAVQAGLPLPNAMTLATVDEAGAPDARIVLLKGLEHGGFTFYTNYRSRKGRELEARPQACLVFQWSELERQVRVEGIVAALSEAEADAQVILTAPKPADFELRGDQVRVGGRRYGLFAHDFRQVPVDALLELVTERALAQDVTPSPPTVTPPPISPRNAVVISDTGLTSTKARSQSGMVAGSTMMLEAKTRGKRKVKPMVITVIGVRITRPSTMKTQPTPKPMATSSTKAPTTPEMPASGRYPRISPMPRMIKPAMRCRRMSPTIRPAKGESGQIGSERKRSNRPLPRSVDRPMPE